MANQMTIRGKYSSRIGGWKYNPFIRAAIYAVLAVLIFVSLVDKLVPRSYQLEPGVPSEQTIYAPRQIVDRIATGKAQQEAAEQVPPVYTVVALRNEQLVDRIFEMLDRVNADEAINSSDKASVYQIEFPKMYNEFVDSAAASLAGGYSEPFIEEVKKQLREQTYRMPVRVYFKLPNLTREDLAAMRPVATDLVTRLMNEQVIDAQAGRTRVAELVNQSELTKSTHREIVQEIVRFAVTPNKFFDSVKTQQAKENARANTEPVTIAKGDVLVAKGQIVTEEVFNWLKEERVLKEKTDYKPFFGVAIWAVLLVLMLFITIRQSQHAVSANNAQLLMFALIVAFNVLLMRIVALAQTNEYPTIGYLAPVGVGVMLIAILPESSLAIASAVLFALMAGVIFRIEGDGLFDFRFGFVALVIGLTSVFAIHRAGQRTLILRAGILVSLTALLAAASLMLLEQPPGEAQAVNLMRDVLFPLLFALTNGLITAVLVIGVLPFFESVFGMLSPLKLLELSNPNHPLLRKLLTETPGTYHHSVMVGNLSESAAEAIGANGLLCRVGSFYHDIGKTKRPSYFIENQTNIENPHDRIDPELSKSIIIAHARDGVEMLKEYNIPKPIRDIAEQHHGTTLLKYFYHKAKKLHPDRPVSEEDYRYPGPKAQSKEAAIVGIADCVEAAVRSMRNPTVEEIDRMVRRIIKDRLDDGQFNECDLTLRELDIVAESLKETLLGIFHSRIEYPGNEKVRGEAGGESGRNTEGVKEA